MANSRQLLEEYISQGKLMQVATQDEQGPWLFNVWYAPKFGPDRLYFISNVSRNHSAQIRGNGRVAGGIVHEELEQLGQKVRGVTFRGRAAELPTQGVDEKLALFLERWPTASDAISRESLAKEETPMRLYEIEIQSWVLFDEVNFPSDPRQEVDTE